MEKEQIVSLIKQINDSKNEIACRSFDYLQQCSGTREELEKNIMNTAAQIRWENQNLATWIKGELTRMLNERGMGSEQITQGCVQSFTKHNTRIILEKQLELLYGWSKNSANIGIIYELTKGMCDISKVLLEYYDN